MRSATKMTKRPTGMDDLAYVEMLREAGPAIDPNGFIWCFSHAHMLACVDPNTTRQIEMEKMTAIGVTEGAVFDYFANALLFANGEAHIRRRGPLAKAFAFPVMAALRPRARNIAEALIRPHLGREVDLLSEIAGPLPARLVASIIGAPETDIPYFSALVYDAMKALSRLKAAPEEEARLAELTTYVEGLLADRRANPADNFLTGYLRDAEDVGMSAAEMRAQIVAIILAGSDTTRMALCSTLSQLLQAPEQWADFCAAPEDLKASVAAEGLRFDPVVGSLPRIATKELALDDVVVKAGTILAPSIIGALHDPAVYEAPDRFNIHREDHPRYHPIFGAGAHRCLGEALARIELEEALAAFATLAPDMRMTGAPPKLRGLSAARSIDQMSARL